MKTLFNSNNDNATVEADHLLMEIGKDYCCYATWHKPSQAFLKLSFISFDALESDQAMEAIISELNAVRYSSVVISSALPQAMLVPTKFFKNDYAALNLLHQMAQQVYLNDAIAEWQMTTIYSIPKTLHQQLTNGFNHTRFLHAYTPAIKVYNGFIASHQISLHFTPNQFRLLLKKEAAIHLAQTYTYHSPPDVVYYLLSICQSFQLQQAEVYLIISGLVAEDSGLYNELQQYFSNVHFAHLPQMQLPQGNHPHYFFTPLYNLALCVS